MRVGLDKTGAWTQHLGRGIMDVSKAAGGGMGSMGEIGGVGGAAGETGYS